MRVTLTEKEIDYISYQMQSVVGVTQSAGAATYGTIPAKLLESIRRVHRTQQTIKSLVYDLGYFIELQSERPNRILKLRRE